MSLKKDIYDKEKNSEQWREQLSELRIFYSEYHRRLKESLKSRGISVAEASTKGLDENGRPLLPVFRVPGKCIHLRKKADSKYYESDECAIFTVKAKDAVFAIPDNGIGIRYMKGSLNLAFMNRANNMANNNLLALASDGSCLYGLTLEGEVVSTRKQWQLYQMFNKVDEIKRITYQTISKQQIEETVKEIEQGNVSWTWGFGTSTYKYDCEQKAFIWEYESGSSHDGIDQKYAEADREELLWRMLRYSDIKHVAFAVQKGGIPPILIAELLSIHEKNVKINLPESYRLY